MASPFSLFRRYQKVLLAVFGVLLMVTFVITPSLESLFRRGPGRDPVVFRTHDGDMRESELQHQIELRRRAHRFLAHAIELAVASSQLDMTLPPQQLHQVLVDSLYQSGIDIQREVGEEAFVKSMIIARKAEKLGLVVSDEAINEFLRERTLERMTREQFREINSQLKITQRDLFNALRIELLTARLHQMFFKINLVQAVPPGLRWDYFDRLNRRVSVQAIGLDVDDFLSQVGEPEPSALQSLYEAHKDQYAIPGQPTPGFHQPEKAEFQYFKADYEKFGSDIEVSDADVAEYYETNKRTMFIYRGFPTAPAADEPAAAEPGVEGSDASDAASEGAEGAEAPASTSERDAAAPDGTPAAGPQGGGGDDADGEAPGDKNEEPSEGDDAGAADAPSLNPGANAVADDSAQAESPASVDDAAEEKADKPAVVEPNPDLVTPADILEGPNPEFAPLWSVEEEIRTQIRRQRANEQVTAAFGRLAEIVEDYGGAHSEYEFRVEELGADKAGTAPVAPDFSALAEKYGVTFHATGLISPFDAQDIDLGASYIGGTQPFVSGAFAALRLRMPRRSVDFDGNQYLFWKVAEERDFVPTFDQAREAVARAWRLQQARKLAEQKAQEMADEANRSGRTLKELFGVQGKYDVVETGEFTWMTESTARSPDFSPGFPEISQVSGIEKPGHDFMRAVFGLQPNQAGAALNAPQSIAYVVQAVSQSPPAVVLRERFLVAPYPGYRTVALIDETESERDWVAKLEEEAGLDWVRPPEQRIR